MVPERDPPHPVTDSISDPVPGVNVKLAVWPWVTVADPGVIVPLPVPVVVVETVNVGGGGGGGGGGGATVAAKLAVTVHAAVIEPVV